MNMKWYQKVMLLCLIVLEERAYAVLTVSIPGGGGTLGAKVRSVGQSFIDLILQNILPIAAISGVALVVIGGILGGGESRALLTGLRVVGWVLVGGAGLVWVLQQSGIL